MRIDMISFTFWCSISGPLKSLLALVIGIKEGSFMEMVISLVEAAGIEPASESTTLKPLHAYPTYLISDTGLPAGRPADTLSP